MLFKGTNLQISPRDLMHSIMNIDSNIVLSMWWDKYHYKGYDITAYKCTKVTRCTP